jgi:endonuclease III
MPFPLVERNVTGKRKSHFRMIRKCLTSRNAISGKRQADKSFPDDRHPHPDIHILISSLLEIRLTHILSSTMARQPSKTEYFDYFADSLCKCPVGLSIDNTFLNSSFTSPNFHAIIVNYKVRDSLQRQCTQRTWEIAVGTPSIQSFLINQSQLDPTSTSSSWKAWFLRKTISEIVAKTKMLVCLHHQSSKYKLLDCFSHDMPVEVKEHLLLPLFKTIARLCRQSIELQLQSISEYHYQAGPNGGEKHTFQLFAEVTAHVHPVPILCLVTNDLIRYRSSGAMFSDTTICKMTPSPSLKRTRPFSSQQLTGMHSNNLASNNLDQNSLIKVETYCKSMKSKIKNFLYELSCIEDLYRLSCIVIGHKPYRSEWLSVFTTFCHNLENPCGSCRNCRIRVCQAAMVIFAAQGVGDNKILPLLGAVFRHPRYKHMSIEQWASLSIAELAAIFKTASKHCHNAYHYHFFLSECMENGPPLHLSDLLCFRGISKKSGCLFLKAVLNVDVGIVTDRHVFKAARGLKWIPEEGVSEELASYMLEKWVPQTGWDSVNVWLAGIRQIAANNIGLSMKMTVCANFLESTNILSCILGESYQPKENIPAIVKHKVIPACVEATHHTAWSVEKIINLPQTIIPSPRVELRRWKQKDIRKVMK